MPIWARDNWLRFKGALLEAHEDWEVWTDWYEARLRGGAANESLEFARITIAPEIWRQDPSVLNAHIRELIKKHATSKSASALDVRVERAGVAKEDQALPSNGRAIPLVPPQRRAAIEPTWSKGRLILPKTATKLDFDKRKFIAALSALRAELRELADDVSAEANIDKRPARFFGRLADRIPESVPTQDGLFRLGHVETVLVGFAKIVEEEWPDFLAARYQAITLQFDRTMRQSPLWREFKRNAAKETLSVEQITEAKSLAREAAIALQANEAVDFVDRAIPNNLERLAEFFSVFAEENEQALAAINEGGELLAADLIESVNNILKPIAEVALRASLGYGKNFGKSFEKAAKKHGTKDGALAVKWLRRIVVWSAKGGAVGGGSFVALSSLLAKYPEAFSWLEKVLPFLK